MPYLRLPDNSYMEVPQGVSQGEALKLAREKYKELFEPAPKADTGFTGAFKAGVENLKADIERVKGKTGIKDVAEAEKSAAAYEKKAGQIFKPTDEGWSEAPFQKFKETLGGSIPYMGAPVVAGGAAALAGAPLAVGTGLAGLASLTQFTGSNLGRQMKGDEAEGVAPKSLAETSLGTSVAGAIPQTALDMISLRMIPGIGKIFGEAGKKITPEMAKQVAEQGITKTIGAYGAQAVKTGGIEGITEAGQQVLERLQAGLSITNEKARDEYFDSFIGGAVLGGTLAVPGTAMKRGEIKSEGARLQREQEAKAAEQQRLADEARKKTPEYRQELLDKRNDLQANISVLQDAIKDKRVDPEAQKESKSELKVLQQQMRELVGELKETVPLPNEPVDPTAKLTLEQFRQQREAELQQQQQQQAEAEKQQADLATAATKAEASKEQFVQQYQSIYTAVNTLTDQLQNAMKEGNVDVISRLGEELDNRNAELAQLSGVAKKAGINLSTPELELKKALAALNKASEDRNILDNPEKRNALVQNVKTAQARVEENKAKQAESAALAEKQVQRANVLAEEEETGAPFDQAAYDEKVKTMREPISSRLTRLATDYSARTREVLREDAFETWTQLPKKEKDVFNNSFDKYFEDQKSQTLTPDVMSDITAAIEAKSLNNSQARALDLPTQAGTKKWTFSTATKDTDKLAESVEKQLALIDENDAFIKEQGMDLPTDPRREFLEAIMVKLADIGYSQKEKIEATDIGTRLGIQREFKGRGAEVPVSTRVGKDLPIGIYTPAHMQKLRADINNIKDIFKADKNLAEETKTASSRIRTQITNISKKLKNTKISAEDRQNLKAALKNKQDELENIVRPQQLTKDEKAELSRRLGRLEEELANTQLGYKGDKPTPLMKLASRLESAQLKLDVAKTPAQQNKIKQQIKGISAQIVKRGGKILEDGTVVQTAEVENLASKKGVSQLPEAGAKGTPVTPAKREEGLLLDIQDTIDSLRKGEFIGGAAGAEGKKLLVNETREKILDKFGKDVESLAESIISNMNVSLRAQKKAELPKQAQDAIRSIVKEYFKNKAVKATGWRAEKQREKATNALYQEFLKAGFDLNGSSAEERYRKYMSEAGITDEEFVTRNTKKLSLYGTYSGVVTGEATETLQKLRLDADKLENRFYDENETLQELKQKKENTDSEITKTKLEAQKKIGELAANFDAAEQKFKETEAAHNQAIKDILDFNKGTLTVANPRTFVANTQKLVNKLYKELQNATAEKTKAKRNKTVENKKIDETLKELDQRSTDIQNKLVEKDTQVRKLENQLRDAENEYGKERRQFSLGEQLGKGAIRTGMRDAEREQIGEFIETVKRVFGADIKPPAYKEPEAVTAEIMADDIKLPKELQELQKKAQELLDEHARISESLKKLVDSNMPVAATEANELRDLFFYKEYIDAPTFAKRTKSNAILRLFDRLTLANMTGYVASLNDQTQDAKNAYNEAKEIEKDVFDKIGKILKTLQVIYAREKSNVEAKVRTDFADDFKQLKVLTEQYLETSTEFQKQKTAYFEQKRSDEAVDRAKEAGTEAAQIKKTVKASESKAGIKTGLGLYGKKSTVVTTQATLRNIDFTNMLKKVGPLRKLRKEIDDLKADLNTPEAERTKQIAQKQAAFNKLEAETVEYGEKVGFGTDENSLTQLYIDLAGVNENTPEASNIKAEIEQVRQKYENQASFYSQSTRVVTEVGPKGALAREQDLKALQAEQTEETKRMLDRLAKRLSEKQRSSELEKREKRLAKHLANKRPEDTNGRKRYDNETIALTADVMVAKNEDFSVLRGRGQVKREAFENRFKPTEIQKQIQKLIRAAEAKKEKGEALTQAEEQLIAKTGLTLEAYTTRIEEAYKEKLRKTNEQIKPALNDKAIDKLVERAKSLNAKEKEAFLTRELLKTEFRQAFEELQTEENTQKFLEKELNVLDLPFKSVEEYKRMVENNFMYPDDVSESGLDQNDYINSVFRFSNDKLDPRIEKAHGGKGLEQSQAQAHVNKITMPKGLKLLVMAKLPRGLREKLVAQGYTDAELDGLRGGVLANGDVFVIADNHADIKDLDRTLAHEITGHLGVEGVLGQDGLDALAAKVSKQEGGVLGLAEKLGVAEDAAAAYASAKRGGKSEEFALGKALREVIAHVSEARVDKGFLGKANEFIKALVGAIRAALRKRGINLDINTSDVYKILRDARKSSKAGVGLYVGRDGEIQLSTKPAEYGPNSSGLATASGRLLTKKQESLFSRIFTANSGLVINTKFFDRLAPLMRVFENKGMANSLTATQIQYYVSMYDQRFAWLSKAISKGVPKLRKEKNGAGFVLSSEEEGANMKKLAEILSTANWGNAEGVRNAYSIYRIAKRAKRVGLDKLNFSPDVTPKMLSDAMRDVENNKQLKAVFEKADAVYDQYNRDLLDLQVAVGTMSKKQAYELTMYNDYIPYYRKIGDDVVLDVGGTNRIVIGNLKYQKNLEALVGGDDRIVDIYAGALQNTNMLMEMALSNLSTRNIAFALNSMGLLKEKRGFGDGNGPANSSTIRFKIDGEPKFAVVNTEAAGVSSELLVHGLEGVSVSLPTIIKIMGMPANLLRTWVTRNPAYALRQVIRDPFVATMAAGVDTVPMLTSFKAVAKAFRNTKDNASGIEDLGVLSSHVFSGTPEDIQKVMLQITSGKGAPAWDRIMSRLDLLALQGDAATRQVAFDSYLKQGLTEMEAILATHKTMPFSQRGTSPSLYWVSTMVPFMNAQIQGLNVLYKAFTGKMPFNEKLNIRRKLFQRGAMMFALSFMYALMMEDDEAYQNATDEERYNNWFVRTPLSDEPVKIPIPFELGIIFKAVPEALANVMFGDKKASEAADALRRMVLNAVPVGPSAIPQAIKTPIEILADHSFYTGRSIIGERLAGVDPNEQFNQNTSELAKLIGSVTGQVPVIGKYLSPVMLDYAVRGYLGSVPLAVASLTNPVFSSEVRPEKKASEMPLFGSFFQSNDAGGIINRAYKDIEDVQKAKKTYTKLEEEGRDKEAEEYADAKADLLGMASMAGRFVKKMGQLTADEREIRSDPNMSAGDKRKALDEIRKEKIELSRDLSSERE